MEQNAIHSPNESMDLEVWERGIVAVTEFYKAFAAVNEFNIKPVLEYFDSLAVAKKTWPELESHRLTELGAHFGIEYLAHDALEDSRTCGQIINLAADKWGAGSVEELLENCGVAPRKFL